MALQSLAVSRRAQKEKGEGRQRPRSSHEKGGGASL